jgi:ribosomal protein L15
MPLQRRVPKFGFTNINQRVRGCKLDTLQLLVDNGVITDTAQGRLYCFKLSLPRMKSLRSLEEENQKKLMFTNSTATAKYIEAAGGEAVIM